MKPTFKCASCRQVLPEQTTGGTGYGVDSGGRKHCYACCAVRDSRRMQREGRATLYLSSRERAPGLKGYEVTNWPGTLRIPVSWARPSRNNWNAPRVDVWFTGPDGKNWHGVNVGDNQILRCKRLKG